MDYSLKLISSVNQIRKGYETFNPVTDKDASESYKNHTKLAINQENNPFIKPGILKSFNINYIRDNMIPPETYNKAVNLLESGKLLSTKETAFFIYNFVDVKTNDSVSVQSSPLSSGKFDLRIEQLAANQINTGIKYSATDAAGIASGLYALNISAGGKNNFISTQFNGSETQSEAMSKIAAAINSADIDITAEVHTDNHDSNLKYLALSSNKTGALNSFVISDLVGDLQSRYLPNGAEHIKSVAKDAVYYINNRQNTASTNSIFLEQYNAVINLKAVDTNNQSINFNKDTEYTAKTLGAYINKLSSFIDDLKEKQSTHSTITVENIFNDLKKIDGALKELGINIDYKKKNITFDSLKMEQALKTNIEYVENAFSGAAGITAVINNSINEYLQIPVDLFALPRENYESYTYIPTGYNIYNPYDVRNSMLRV